MIETRQHESHYVVIYTILDHSDKKNAYRPHKCDGHDNNDNNIMILLGRLSCPPIVYGRHAVIIAVFTRSPCQPSAQKWHARRVGVDFVSAVTCTRLTNARVTIFFLWTPPYAVSDPRQNAIGTFHIAATRVTLRTRVQR